VDSFLPTLQFFKLEHIETFKDPGKVGGEFTTEFMLVVTEIMAIRETGQLPRGSLTESLYRDFVVKDRFQLIQKAVLKKLS